MRRQSSYNRNRKDVAKKEKIIMITTSALVLGALTMTGVYVKNGQNNKQDGYQIDYESLEKNVEDEIDRQISGQLPSITTKENTTANDNETARQTTKGHGMSEGIASLPENNADDLDYFPMEPVDSANVEIADGTGEEDIPDKPVEEEIPDEKAEKTNTGKVEIAEKELHFNAENGIVWPISGSILIPYSMDGTVYFKTLDQYKYNPAMIISAKEDTAITASIPGKVVSVFYDDEIGNGVKVDIGDGYEITYGQLKNIAVKQGDYLENGTLIGSVNAPTKYYVLEGANLYIKLCKDGEPVDPMHPSGEIIE